jgi:hypothetical protein
MTREAASPYDRESDIHDVPLPRVIDSELHAINKRTDTKLIIALALNLAVVVVFARLHIKSLWLDVVEAAVVVTITGATIFSVVARRRRVAQRHGLVCSMCAYAPSGESSIISAAITQRCRKCRARLPIATRGQCPLV